jgi:hypothetical protein
MRIKLTSWWCTDDIIRERYNRLTPYNNYKWKDMELVLSDDYDFVVVQGSTFIEYNPKKTIVIQSEPSCYRSRNYNDYYISDKGFFSFFDIDRFYPIDHWILDAKYSDILNIDLDKKISRLFGIFSSKSELQGHKDRLNFLYNVLDNMKLYDGYLSSNRGGYESINESIRNMKSFKSVLDDNFLPYRDYRYTFQGENCYENNYFTEKVIRSIICGCLTFYSGCPNLEKFIHPNCFIRIDCTKLEESMDILYKSIYDNEWEKRLSTILKQRDLLMNDNNTLNIIRELIVDGEFKWKTI